MDFTAFATVAGGVFTGVITGGGVVYMTIKGWKDDLTALRRQVEQEQANRITRVEHNVEALRDKANPELIARRLDTVDSQLEKIAGKLDKQAEQLTRVETNVANQKEDIDRAHQKISAIRRTQGEFDR